MSLRNRIVLTLLAITFILVAPAAYGFFALNRLERIVKALREQDAEATAALGDFSTSVETLQLSQSNFVVLKGTPRTEPDYAQRMRDAETWRARADGAVEGGNAQLQKLLSRPDASGVYRRATLAATREWEQLKDIVREERRLIEGAGERDPLASFRKDQVLPAFTAVNDAIRPIEAAIREESRQRVDRAANVAASARAGALVALAAALVLTMVIGAWLTRSLLRPIAVLRRGMGHVARGDLEPDVRVPTERPDEIGDLARSFTTMTEQLAALDRLKAEFVSVASHEIKTPLSVIRGYVSLLADGIYGPVNDQQKKTLRSVSDQTDRLTRLVHRLLDISRFEAGGGRLELRPIVLRDFFADLTDDFRVLAVQNGITFPVTLARDLPETLVGDPDRLNEVLGNLLSNAFKFTGRGGTIRVDAHRNGGGGIVVEVEDTGVGIPSEKLPRIFEKFFQVENEAQPRSVGSGLGLAIAREIVEAHGGTITAESQEGVGTRFRVALPERPPVPQAS